MNEARKAILIEALDIWLKTTNDCIKDEEDPQEARDLSRALEEGSTWYKELTNQDWKE